MRPSVEQDSGNEYGEELCECCYCCSPLGVLENALRLARAELNKRRIWSTPAFDSTLVAEEAAPEPLISCVSLNVLL